MNNKLRAFLLTLATGLVFASLATPSIMAQDDEDPGQPVLEKGIPTLKYRRGDGYVMRIQLITWKDAEALSCPTMGIMGNRYRFGDLIVSKTRVAFQPYEEKNKEYGFDLERSAVTLFQYGNHSQWNGGISLFGGNKDKDVRLQFQSASYRENKKQTMYPMITRKDDKDGYLGEGQNFVLLAFAYANFDEGLQKFKTLTAGLVPLAPSSAGASASSATAVQPGGDVVKQGLWERFINNRKTNPDVAYQAAKAYIQLYPNDSDENAQLIKKWAAAYDKVKSGQPNNN